MMIAVGEEQIYAFIPPLVALVVSFFTSMGGISGAFLLLPFQMSVLNYTSPSVSAKGSAGSTVGKWLSKRR